MAKAPINIHSNYHAHVYYDETSLEHATAICKQAGELFHIKVGRLHEKNVGPHPRWSCQLSFDSNQFDDLIPWLDEKRKDLSILVHGVTGDDLQDHTEYAYWLGEELELNLSIFKQR